MNCEAVAEVRTDAPRPAAAKGGAMLQDLRFALRTLRRNPGFTAASVAVLALGIGASTAVFSVVWAVLLKPLPYPHPEQLVQLWGASPKRGIPFHFMPYADVAAWRAVDAFSHLSAYQPAEMTLTTGGEPERVPLMRVNASFLPMLGAGFAAGRGFTVAEDVPGAPRTAVMGHELWKRRFGGDPGITGRTVELDGHPYRICGVLDAGFLFGNRPAAFYLPLALPARREAASLVPVGAFGRLRSGANPAQAQGGIDALHAADPALRDRTAKVWTLRGFLVRDVRDSLRLLTFAVGLVLLLACANTAALQLARTASRREEFAVRAALGATNVRLLVQVAIECAVPAALGAFAGLGFASALLRIIPALPADRFPLVHRASIDITAAGVALAAAVFATLAGAIVPGLAVRTRPSASRSVTERSAAQNLLIGAEVALAVLLLAAAGVVGRALLRLHQADPGFDSRHVLTASVTLDPPALRTLLHKLSTHPGVESAGATNILPMTIHNTAVWFLPEGRPVPPPAEIPTVWWRTVDAGYLQALRIPLRRGRLPREGEADRVAVVNEALARRFWPGENPVGRRFQMNHP
ncbi:MAG TPA: permease, partial [Solibacterales bacterium]|nr:permease [Bryobacterales bacterium]